MELIGEKEGSTDVIHCGAGQYARVSGLQRGPTTSGLGSRQVALHSLEGGLNGVVKGWEAGGGGGLVRGLFGCCNMYTEVGKRFSDDEGRERGDTEGGNDGANAEVTKGGRSSSLRISEESHSLDLGHTVEGIFSVLGETSEIGAKRFPQLFLG